MNKDYHIYSAPEDELPLEDVARLDGYLKGREEAAKLNEVNDLKKKFQEIFKTKN